MTDVDPFEEFVRRYQHMVFGIAVRLLGDPSEAEDVAQTVFLRAFERFSAIESSPAAAGWLRTVTTNLCLNHLRRVRWRWRFFSELDTPDGTGEARFEQALATNHPGPSEAEQASRDLQLEQALRQLPAHQRVPLVLFHFENHSYQDIAARLGVSLGKVKTDIHRGRHALRTALAVSHD